MQSIEHSSLSRALVCLFVLKVQQTCMNTIEHIHRCNITQLFIEYLNCLLSVNSAQLSVLFMSAVVVGAETVLLLPAEIQREEVAAQARPDETTTARPLDAYTHEASEPSCNSAVTLRIKMKLHRDAL